MARKGFNKRSSAKARGYRSGLEEIVQAELQTQGVSGEYEQHKIEYTKPATTHSYTPDFKLPNGIFVETKGRFVYLLKKIFELLYERNFLDE